MKFKKFKLLILFSVILSSVSFAGTSQLIDPKNDEIIDIGYQTPITSKKKLIKEWLLVDASLRNYELDFRTKVRVLTKREGCFIDSLGHENCPIKSNTCQDGYLYDNGNSERIDKTRIIPATLKDQAPDGWNKALGEIEYGVSFGNNDIDLIAYVYRADQSVIDSLHLRYNHKPTDGGYLSADKTSGGTEYIKIQANRYKAQGARYVDFVINSYSHQDLNSYGAKCYIINSKGIRQDFDLIGSGEWITLMRFDLETGLILNLDPHVELPKEDVYECKDETYTLRESDNMCLKDYHFYKYDCDELPYPSGYKYPGYFDWVGPLITSGADDCLADCGPNGCSCNSSSAPWNNCSLENKICNVDPSKACTKKINEDTVSGIDLNAIGQKQYTLGTSQNYESSIRGELICKEGLTWNSVSKKCERQPLEKCERADQTRDERIGCYTRIYCEEGQEYDGLKKICVKKYDEICEAGEIYDSNLDKCISNVKCADGILNSSKKCIQIIDPNAEHNSDLYIKNDEICPTDVNGVEWKFNKDTDKCEAPVIWNPFVCEGSGWMEKNGKCLAKLEGWSDAPNSDTRAVWSQSPDTLQMYQGLNAGVMLYINSKSYTNNLIFSGTFQVLDSTNYSGHPGTPSWATQTSSTTWSDDDFIGFVFGYDKNTKKSWILSMNRNVLTGGGGHYFDGSKKGSGISLRYGNPLAHGWGLKATSTLAMKAFNAGTKTELQNDPSIFRGWNRWEESTLKVEYNTNKIIAYVNGVKVIDYDMQPGEFKSGNVGFLNYSQGGVLYKDFELLDEGSCGTGLIFDPINRGCYVPIHVNYTDGEYQNRVFLDIIKDTKETSIYSTSITCNAGGIYNAVADQCEYRNECELSGKTNKGSHCEDTYQGSCEAGLSKNTSDKLKESIKNKINIKATGFIDYSFSQSDAWLMHGFVLKYHRLKLSDGNWYDLSQGDLDYNVNSYTDESCLVGKNDTQNTCATDIDIILPAGLRLVAISDKESLTDYYTSDNRINDRFLINDEFGFSRSGFGIVAPIEVDGLENVCAKTIECPNSERLDYFENYGNDTKSVEIHANGLTDFNKNNELTKYSGFYLPYHRLKLSDNKWYSLDSGKFSYTVKEFADSCQGEKTNCLKSFDIEIPKDLNLIAISDTEEIAGGNIASDNAYFEEFEVNGIFVGRSGEGDVGEIVLPRLNYSKPICVSTNTLKYCNQFEEMINGKCTINGECGEGFILDPESNNCIRHYSYNKYFCPAGYTISEEGSDCNGECLFDHCECNSKTPPSNNCAKPAITDNDNITTKIRDIRNHETSGAVDPLEYGEDKNYACGDNCGFNVNKIVGENNSLCFYKNKKAKQCIAVDGCSFTGTINNEEKALRELYVKNGYQLSVKGEKEGSLVQDPDTLQCMPGTIYNKLKKECLGSGEFSTWHQEGPADDGDWSVRDGGNTVYQAVNGRPTYFVSPDTYNDNVEFEGRMKVGINWDDDYVGLVFGFQDINNYLVVYSSRDHSDPNSFSPTHNAERLNLVWRKNGANHMLVRNMEYDGWRAETLSIYKVSYIENNIKVYIDGQLYIDYTDDSIDRFPRGKIGFYNYSQGLVTYSGFSIKSSPVCDSAYQWNEETRSCLKESNTDTRESNPYGTITSTCKMNGQVGWINREEGIVSAIPSGNKILFWDSYKDGNLGFLEFVKDTNDQDKEDGYIPEFQKLFDVQNDSFTAMKIIGNDQVFVSSKKMTSSSCNYYAQKHDLRVYNGGASDDFICPTGTNYSSEALGCLKFIGTCESGQHDEKGNCIDYVNNTIYGDIDLINTIGSRNGSQTTIVSNKTASGSLSLSDLISRGYGNTDRIEMQIATYGSGCGGIYFNPQPTGYKKIQESGEVAYSSHYCGQNYLVGVGDAAYAKVEAYWDNPPSSISFGLDDYASISQIDRSEKFEFSEPICQSGYTFNSDKEICEKVSVSEHIDTNELKILSGDRYETKSIIPSCVSGVFIKKYNRCLDNINAPTICTNGKFKEVDTLEKLTEIGVWTNDDRNFNLTKGIYLSEDGKYTFYMDTDNEVEFYVDGIRRMIAKNYAGFNLDLNKGLHEIQVIASGSVVGFKVTKNNVTILTSRDFCDNVAYSPSPDNIDCPETGFRRIGNSCHEISDNFCKQGEKSPFNRCIIEPKCILVGDNNTSDFEKQKISLRREYAPDGEEEFVCSPLSCIDGCQEARCVDGYIGTKVKLSSHEYQAQQSGAICTDQDCDANKVYFSHCGKDQICPTKTNKRVVEDVNGNCKEKYCPEGTYDEESARCRVEKCPIGTSETVDGLCEKD